MKPILDVAIVRQMLRLDSHGSRPVETQPIQIVKDQLRELSLAS